MSIAMLWRGLLLTVTVVIGFIVFYYALIFEGQLPDNPALRGKNDLALHFAAFFALGVPILLLTSWCRVAAVLVTFAGLVEIAHLFQPEREAAWSDFAASVAGVGLAGLVVSLLRGIESLITWSETKINE